MKQKKPTFVKLKLVDGESKLSLDLGQIEAVHEQWPDFHYHNHAHVPQPHPGAGHSGVISSTTTTISAPKIKKDTVIRTKSGACYFVDMDYDKLIKLLNSEAGYVLFA